MGLLRFTNVHCQGCRTSNRQDGPSYANERSKECTNELQTTQSIAKGKRRQQPSELITPSTAQGDAVLGYLCASRTT